MTEHVRTPAGAAFFHEPIGSPIMKHEGGVQTPSQFRHPSTGAPMGKTEIGDTFEEIFRKKGAHLLEKRFASPYSPIAHAKVKGKLTARNTPLDFKLNGTHGGELKTLNVNAKSKKAAIKAEEVKRKVLATQNSGVKPLLAVQVVDMDKGHVEVYAHPAFESKTVTRMEHLGSYDFSREDFRNAQQATGHWDKRHARAAQAEAAANDVTARSATGRRVTRTG
jgi:hypothetical protein